MAFNPRIIPATDFQPNVGVGVNLPFSHPQCFTSNFTSTAALKNNIINYFLTEPGERLDNPLFGGGLRKFLFEQITNNTLEGIEDHISSKLESQFPSVRLDRIDVLRLEDSNTVRVIIKYSIPQQGVSDDLEINFG
jgi:phage baseplate assembly protein W